MIFAGDSMGVCLLLCMQLSLIVEPSSLNELAQKPSLTWNSHSRSFILQSITSQKGIVYQHIIMLASIMFLKKEPAKKMSLSATTLSFQLVWCFLSEELPEYLHVPDISGNLSCWQYGSVFIQNFFVACSIKCIFSATDCVSAVQGYSRSLILVPIKIIISYHTVHFSGASSKTQAPQPLNIQVSFQECCKCSRRQCRVTNADWQAVPDVWAGDGKWSVT